MHRVQVVFLFLLLSFTSPHNIFSQRPVKIAKRDFRVREDGFKRAWKSLRAGDDLFRKGVGSYPAALERYRMAYHYNAEDPGLNYRIGVCYLFTDHKAEALSYLQAAYAADSTVAGDIDYLLGRAYQYRYEFDKALPCYQAFLRISGDRVSESLVREVHKHIAECEAGMEVVRDTVPAKIVDMGSAINSSWDDYKPLLTLSGDELYFTSRRPYSPKQLPNRGDGKFEEDVYVSLGGGDGWSAAVRQEKPLNTRYNDAALAISPGGKELYVYNGKKGNGDIFTFRRKHGKWSKVGSMIDKINTRWQESSLWISPDSSTVYFVSANKKLTHGGKDIFVMQRDARGKWGDPVPLDTTVNTEWDEESPWLTPDGKTLYFSSQGHNSMGGFDVFRCHLQEDGRWSEPENLGVPLNTPDDDLFYFPSPTDTLVAYISGIRGETHGLKDIYQVTWIHREKDPIASASLEIRDDVPVVPEGGGVRSLGLVIPVVHRPQSVVVTGKILDRESGAPLMASIDVIDVDKNEITGKTISRKSDGVYTLRVKERKSFGVEINAPGYMFLLDFVQVPVSDTVTRVVRDFRLKKIQVGATVVLQNIFFETNRSVITPLSYPALDRVINFMTKNPGIKVEIDGHTDSVGSDTYNQRLSQARAQAVVEYLVKHGISRDRLVAKGFGESKPVAPNTTAEGRAKNRRVEFKILKM